MSTPPRSQASLAPMLHVRRGVEAAQFYQAAFGAEELWRITAPDGSIVAHFHIAGVAGFGEFWIHDEAAEYARYSPEALGGSTVRIVLNVADPDALFARAVAAGAKVLSEPKDHDYGWRQGSVIDPFGHHWEISKQLE